MICDSVAPKLRGSEGHVWAADLDDPAVAPLAESIDSSERARADEFVHARDRDRFAVGRGLLRSLLGAYVDVPPRALRFTYGVKGKPALAGDQALRFNVAHAGPLALYALASGREVGIDVERILPERVSLHIASAFFTPREAEGLRGLTEPARTRAFFASWTRREAYLKATGRGLSALDEVDVLAEASAEGWFVRDLPIGSDYVAAVATKSADCRLRVFRFRSGRAPSALAVQFGLLQSARAHARGRATSGRT